MTKKKITYITTWGNVVNLHDSLSTKNYEKGMRKGLSISHWKVHSSRSSVQFSSVQLSHSVVSDSLPPQGLQPSGFPCPLPTPGACSNSCPSSQWCDPAISSSVVPFSCLQFFPSLGSFPGRYFIASGGQSIAGSASPSVLPMNIQDWFPLGLTGLISLLSKGLSRVFSNTTVQKHQFFGAQLSL